MNKKLFFWGGLLLLFLGGIAILYSNSSGRGLAVILLPLGGFFLGLSVPIK